MDTDIFASSTRAAGDLAGVLEIDDETAFFYLYDVRAGRSRVLGHIRLACDPHRARAEDFRIVWDRSQRFVAIFRAGVLLGRFDSATRDSWSRNAAT